MSHLKLRSPRVYGYEALKVCSTFVFREDGWGGEAIFVGGPGVMEVFIARHLEYGPAGGMNAHDSSGAKAFGHEIGFQTDLNAAAAQGNAAFGPGDSGEQSFAGHLGGTGGAACPVFQGVLGGG